VGVVANSPGCVRPTRASKAAVVAFSNRAGQSQAIFTGPLKKLAEPAQQGGAGEPVSSMPPRQQRILSADAHDAAARVGLSDGEADSLQTRPSEETRSPLSDFGNQRARLPRNQWTFTA